MTLATKGRRKRAQRLVERAEADPTGVLDQAIVLAREAKEHRDHVSEALALRAAGTAERIRLNIDHAMGHLDEALHVARLSGDPTVEGETRVSRSAVLFLAGRVDESLHEATVAVELLTGGPRAFAVFQLATFLNRCGRVAEAAVGYDEALVVFEERGDRRFEAHTRANRGILRVYAGDLDGADEDFCRAEDLYTSLGLVWAAAVTHHNIGFLLGRRGDLIGALRCFAVAEEAFRELDEPQGALVLDHCETLIAAGLASEALERARAVAEQLTTNGNRADAAEALLCAALAASEADQHPVALDLAGQARLAFDDQHRPDWAAAAALLVLRYDVELNGRSAQRREEARRIQLELSAAGRGREASLAALVGAMADPDPRRGLASVDELSSTGRRTHPPLDLQLLALSARAALRYQLGERAEANRLVSRGHAVMERYREHFAALDIRANVGSHARDLHALGRRMAWEAADARQLFRRVEESRAASVRGAPLLPSTDSELAGLLQDLRVIEARLRRVTEIDERHRLEAQAASLERRAAARARQAQGRAGSEPIVDFGALRRALVGRQLVMLVDIGDELVALVVREAARPELRTIGCLSDIRQHLVSLRMAQRRLARATTSAGARARSTAAATEEVDLLDRFLAPVFEGDGELVIVPPASLQGVPFALLRSTGDRSMVVVPSATVWHAATAKAWPLERVAVLTGPRLARSNVELALVSRAWKAAAVSCHPEASTHDLRRLLAGTDLVHVAAHHRVRGGNAAFSSIEMADGSLSLHEIAGVPRTPSIVVLSGCDSGSDIATAADDLLGFVALLLQQGTRTVIATNSLLPDDDLTCQMMASVHHSLAKGVAPATAVRLALGLGDRADQLGHHLVCFGAGS